MASFGPEIMAAFERQVADDKAVHFIGTARVRFQHLVFRNPIRLPDETILSYLKERFATVGCLQHELGYSIPVIIEDDILELTLEKMGMSPESFRAPSSHHPQEMPFQDGIKLECLHGQHRILAAETFLQLSDHWWTVDLYRNRQYIPFHCKSLPDSFIGLADKTKQRLREGYYSSNYTDGEIFRQMRVSHFQHDGIRQARWQGRLSPTKARDLKSLLRREILVNALDSILGLRGAWSAFKLGSMDVFLTLRCDEEIAHYVAHIATTHSFILDDTSLTEFLDEATINSIQLRAPAVSRDDGDFITKHMQLGGLFPGIEDPVKRSGILQRLLTIDYPIPSLYTLFRDIRYLEPAAELLKALVPAPITTLRQTLHFHFLCPGPNRNTLRIQQSHNSYITVTGDPNDLFEIALRELWLGSLRSVSITVGNAPKRDMDPVKRTPNAPNYFLWFRLVEQAHNIGFSSSQISRALQIDPMDMVMKEMLQKYLPPEIGVLSENRIQQVTETIKEYLVPPTEITDETTTPYITVHGTGEPLLQRCGINPHISSDQADRHHLFFGKVHAPVSDYRNGGDGISSFFVKRCRYLAFLGPESLSDMLRSGISEVT